jgi:hypothetical protein
MPPTTRRQSRLGVDTPALRVLQGEKGGIDVEMNDVGDKDVRPADVGVGVGVEVIAKEDEGKEAESSGYAHEKEIIDALHRSDDGEANGAFYLEYFQSIL